jgi:hypothetical protein
MYERHPLAKDNLDNIGLKDDGKLGQFLKNRGLDTASKHFNGLAVNHEAFVTAQNKVSNDPAFSKDHKDLMIGTKGETVLQAFEKQANSMMQDIQGYRNHLDRSLYTNTIGLDNAQQQMVGLIGKQFNEEGLAYLDRSEYAQPVVTLLAKAGVLEEGIGEMVIEKMNNKHSADTLRDMTEADEAITALESAVETERQIIEYHSPLPHKLEALRNSSALEEVRKITEGV